MSQQPQGITDNALFQQFTKSSQVCSNSFQLLFDTATKLQIENNFLIKLLKANKIEIPDKPMPQNTVVPKLEQPNRATRRAMERQAKKQAKKEKKD